MEIVPCPEIGCTAPAEIVDRWTVRSTDGPLEQLRTRCLARHVLTPLVGDLAAVGRSTSGRRWAPSG